MDPPADELEPLCPQCESLRDPSNYRTVRILVTRLGKSTCGFCQVIHTGVMQFWAPAWGNKIIGRVVHITREQGYLQVSDVADSYMHFALLPGTTCPWGVFPETPGPMIRKAYFGVEGHLEGKALRAINNCVENHQCGNLENPSRLPTRLVDVGETSASVKLVETRGKESQRYACLSHCWGKSQPLQTTKENIYDHMESLPWEHMPTMYKRAIELTRSLGLKYIWIDSLCIVQDDEDDWARESRKMGDTYGHSYVTFAMTSSPDCDDDISDIWEKRIHLDARGTTATTKKPYHVLITNKLRYHTSKDNPKNEPLLKRGWAFQQRIMSPRVLHVRRPEVIWECKETTTCDCGWTRTLGKDHHLRVMAEGSREELVEHWQNLVEEYSSMDFSDPADTLPALSNIAKQMAERRPESGRYLAGLWEDSLITDLLWMNIPARFKLLSKQGPERQHSPSWSWVAHKPGVTFLHGNSYYGASGRTRGEVQPLFRKILRSYITIESVECTLTTSDPFGPVSGGKLTIKGHGMKSRIYGSEEKKNENVSTHEANSNAVAKGDPRVIYDDRNNPFSILGKTAEEYEEQEKGDVVFLPIATLMNAQGPFYEREEDNMNSSFAETLGLVLAYVDRGRGVMRRIGVVYLERNFSILGLSEGVFNVV